MNNLHIHAPKHTDKRLHSGHCPDCDKHSWFGSFFTEWYGWCSTCLNCGRQWQDGEWMDLPFVRGIRSQNIEETKKLWRHKNGTKPKP